MTDKIEIERVELDEVPSEPFVPEHGSVDQYGETFVHEFDKDGNYIGWHKEPSAEVLAERDGE